MDAFLCLCIETLRHLSSSADHMTTGVHHMITSPDHMTTMYECRELILHVYGNLSEITSFLDFSRSIYILKEVICLLQKILTSSFHQYNFSAVNSSLLALFQSDVFIKVLRSWLKKDARIYQPSRTKTRLHVHTLDKTSHASLPHSSMTETIERDFTLEFSLIITVMRKGVLMILRYLASILAADVKATSPTPTTGITAGTCECVYYVLVVA